MNRDLSSTSTYFASTPASFWHWTDEGSAIRWRDGKLICFREELLFVLEEISPLQLPPLGSILLMLAACRDSWLKDPQGQQQWISGVMAQFQDHYHPLIDEVFSGLDKLYAARNFGRSNIATRGALAAYLFAENSPRNSHDFAKEVIRQLRFGLAAEELLKPAANPLQENLECLRCLLPGLRRFTPEQFEFYLDTSLEAPPQPAPVEPPLPGAVHDLIRQLQDDPELGAVARIAQHMLAAIQLPRAVSDPDELPIGGVSDIVNRGPLDRLLLSELAQDDLLLAVRLAMNEALYLRRESPPRTPPRRRRLLLDSGIRTWGIPRVFIGAVGLAMAAQGDAKISVEAYRAENDQATPIQLHSADGLREHLGKLAPGLHPGGSLLALQQTSESDEIQTDLVLVTTDDTLADPGFQRSLRELGNHTTFLAVVSRSGKFELHQRSVRGTKVLCGAQLELQKILAPRPYSRPLTSDTEFPPAFIQQENVPLRLSAPFDPQRFWYVHPKTVITYTRDGRLLLWTNPRQGAQTLAEDLPAGDLLWCSSYWTGADDDYTLRLVVGKRSQRGMHAVTVNRQTKAVTTARLKLQRPHPREVLGRDGHALVFSTDGVEVVSLQSGDGLGGGEFSEIIGNTSSMLRQGRFFAYPSQRTALEWMALAYSPAVNAKSNITYQRVFTEKHTHRFVAITESPLLAGPVAVTTEGQFVSTQTGMNATLPKNLGPGIEQHPFAVKTLGISRDGNRVLMNAWTKNRQNTVLLDLCADQLRIVHGGQAALEEPLQQIARPRTLHNKYRALAITPTHQLVLISRKGQPWPLVVDELHQILRLPSQPPAKAVQPPYVAEAEFVRVDDDNDGTYSLAVAKFGDGSLAWLDSRGLLHLRSCMAQVPELTLVLTDGQLAGWLSDGRVFGPDYWYDNHASISITQVQQEVLLPFALEVR